MKTFKLLLIAFLLFGSTDRVFASDEKLLSKEGYVVIPFNASFVPGISIGDARAKGRKVINRFSLSFVGSAAQLHGAEITYIWSNYSESITGFQYCGIGNSIGENVHGIQVSGIINSVAGDVEGLQYTGIINKVGGNLYGLQWAGIANIVHNGSIGGQWSGIVNVMHGDFIGIQMAGIINLPKENVTGGQWAGIMNRVPGNMAGVQFSGIMNHVSGNLHGAQFAGIMNKADVVKRGLQAGLFNYANEHHGVAIGLISFVKDVGLHVDVWGEASGFGYVGLRSGTARFHNLLFTGKQVDGKNRWTIGWGAGGHYNLSDVTFFEIDGTIQHINESELKWTEDVNALTKLRLLFGWQPARHLAFYAGPTFNLFVSKVHDGEDIAPWTSEKEYDEDEEVWAHSWVGLTAGIRF